MVVSTGNVHVGDSGCVEVYGARQAAARYLEGLFQAEGAEAWCSYDGFQMATEGSRPCMDRT